MNRTEPQKATSNGRHTRRGFIKRTAAIAGTAGLASGIIPRKASARILGANDRIGFAMIGCGGEGNFLMDLVRSISKRDKEQGGTDVQIVAVCDVYGPRLRKAAQKYEAKPYANHRELLADANVDVVGIASPDHIHGGQVIDAVQAGKDVYCEKPVTHWRQFELTKRMAAEVKKSGRVFQLGVQYMSDGAWPQAKKLIADGLIGKLTHVECGFFRMGDFGERGMPIDDPNAKPGPDLNWEAFLGDAPKRPFDVSRFFRWRMYEDYAGGPATDLYPHSLSQAVYMMGVTFPSSVVANGGILRYEEREVPDTFNLLVEYPERISMTMVGSQTNDCSISNGRPPSKAPILRGWDGTLSFQSDYIAFTPNPGNKAKAQKFPIEGSFNHTRHMTNFLDCCRTRQQPYCSVDLAYHTQTVVQMAMLAYRAGKMAKFDAKAEKIVI